ncbi:hypothetical protein NK214_12130 [Chromobacterium sp. S0633]|uniref:hypothetical protein n=1 Tax=Chromobacterium sp. S0633 TaxID=2957805 RepID=UPI00209E2C42|nr:hypothetical protein [Chromobacterium sp. S0633]MCP1290938.1 hypothetical protein [Chromobacterium sp. S0633]
MYVFLLTLVFADGYQGGQMAYTEFKTMTECQRQGPLVAIHYHQKGHPTTFFCQKVKRGPVKPISSAEQAELMKRYPMPEMVTP